MGGRAHIINLEREKRNINKMHTSCCNEQQIHKSIMKLIMFVSLGIRCMFSHFSSQSQLSSDFLLHDQIVILLTWEVYKFPLLGFSVELKFHLETFKHTQTNKQTKSLLPYIYEHISKRIFYVSLSEFQPLKKKKSRIAQSSQKSVKLKQRAHIIQRLQMQLFHYK